MICICQDEERVLKDAEIVALEENVGDGGIGTGEVVDNFDTYWEEVRNLGSTGVRGRRTIETSIGNVTHSMFDGPHNRVLKSRE